jgi:transposase InsO family protein
VIENLLDHYRTFDTRNHLHGTAAGTTGLDVDIEKLLKLSDTMPASICLALYRCFLPCYTKAYIKIDVLFIHIYTRHKAERLHYNEYRTEKELRAIIFEYVGFYNQRRMHASLNYMTPIQFEVSLV